MSGAVRQKPLIGTVAILGVGLIGASLGAAIKRAGVARRVIGAGRTRSNLDAAIAGGCIDEATTNERDAVVGADLVVLAAPVDASVGLLERIVAFLAPAAVLTDVGSVKRPACLAAARVGLAARFVGGHPMAGGTATGAVNADAELFQGKLTLLTPTVQTSESATTVVTTLWERCGARVRYVDADLHDRVVASVSHVPQFLSVCLAEMCATDPNAELLGDAAAGGFASVTRLAMSDPDMWLAIAAANTEPLGEAMEAFGRRWQELTRAVRAGDQTVLRLAMETARRFKESTGK